MGVSFDKIDGVIWYDGKLVPWADANVHVLTHGLHYASAVFEGERAYGGTVFKSREHSERLKQSAQILDFEIPWSVAETKAGPARGQQKFNARSPGVAPRFRCPDATRSRNSDAAPGWASKAGVVHRVMPRGSG